MGEPLAHFLTSAGSSITLHRGDLNNEPVDAVVADLNSIAPGVQLDPAASTALADFVWRNGPIPPGNSIWLDSQGSKARGIILAVGPGWGDPYEIARLPEAARSAFATAVQRDCESIAVAPIGFGTLKLPKPECAALLVRAAIDFLEDHPVEILREIRFALNDDEALAIFREEFIRQFGPSGLVLSVPDSVRRPNAENAG